MQSAVDPASGLPDIASSNNDNPLSAVSWPAIAAGTVVAAAASLLLVALAAGVGLGALSPWPHTGTLVTAFTATTAIGLVVVQWLSAGIGGYVTGRLRTKWVSLHTHEVFFRDTAHGLITWATATLLVSMATAIVAASTTGTAWHATTAAAATAASGGSQTGSIDPYEIDTLLRPASPDAQSAANAVVSNEMRVQTTRILAAGLLRGDVPASDQAYLTQVVASEARVSPADAQTRVDAVVAKVKSDHEQALRAAETARKAAQSASIFTAFAMLIGAFIACIAAAVGGHRRDVHA